MPGFIRIPERPDKARVCFAHRRLELRLPPRRFPRFDDGQRISTRDEAIARHDLEVDCLHPSVE